MSAGADFQFPVIHSVDIWLGRTLAWLHRLVVSLPEAVESHVVCASTENLDEFPVGRLHCYGAGDAPLQRWLAARSWLYQLRRKRTFYRSIARDVAGRGVAPVIVHSHFGTRGWLDRADVRAIDGVHIVSFYGHDLDRVPRVDPEWSDRYRQLFAKVDRVLCEGPVMIERVMVMGCPKSKIRLHHLGVDVASLPFRSRTWQPGSPLRVLLASTFAEKKGIPYAIEALAKVRRHVPLQVSLVGDATPQEHHQREKRNILETIRRCRMSDVITVHGFMSQAELVELAYRHHIYVAPSITAADGDSEGGAPMALPLFAATGMPIISTQHRDIPNVIQDGTSGRLAKERDVAGLAACIEWFAANPARWHDVTTAARSRIEIAFNAALQGERLAAIYREVANERSGH